MAEVTVDLRNAANTSGTEITGAFRPSWQEQRNGLGLGSVYLPNPLAETITKGDIILGRLDGDARMAFIAERPQPQLVSVSDELMEATKWSGRGLLSEWADSRLHDPPTLTTLAQTVPVLDDRVMAWWGPDYDETGDGWTDATFIAVQGWASTFYTGLPAEWSDPPAQWIGPSSGDDENAPEGRCLFRRWTLIGEGPAALDYAGDNTVVAYINGRRVGGGGGYRRKQRYEFEVTEAGWMLLAFELTNAPDDGPPGGNPTALLFSLQAADGSVYCRSDSDTQILEYPSVDPEVPLGRQIRQVMIGNALLDGVWTVTGTETTDDNGVTFPTTGPMTYRLGSDSPWDVVQQSCQRHIDIRVDPEGRTLRPFVKGTVGDASGLTLVSGYSTAGIADPDSVNIDDLSWDIPRAEFDALVVRWERGRFQYGDGDRWGTLDLGKIENQAVAESIADGLLTLVAAEEASASFSVLNPSEVPVAHDTIDVPGPFDVDDSLELPVTGVTISGDDDGDAEVVIETGSLIEDRRTLLERASRRSDVAGALSGVAAAAASAVTAPASSAAAAGGLDVLFSTTADGTVGSTAKTCHPPSVGWVSEFVIEADYVGSGTTTNEVRVNGTLVATLSLGASDVRDVDAADLSWTPSDTVTVTPTADGGHSGVTLYAATSRVR